MSRHCSHGGPLALFANGRSCNRRRFAQISVSIGRTSDGCLLKQSGEIHRSEGSWQCTIGCSSRYSAQASCILSPKQVKCLRSRFPTAAGTGTSKPVQRARISKNVGPARRLTMARRLRSQNEKTIAGLCNYPIPAGSCHIRANTPWLPWSISTPGFT